MLNLLGENFLLCFAWKLLPYASVEANKLLDHGLMINEGILEQRNIIY